MGDPLFERWSPVNLSADKNQISIYPEILPGCCCSGETAATTPLTNIFRKGFRFIIL